MNVRPYSPLDWPTILGWFKVRGWGDIESALPTNGFVAEDESGLVAACWVYLSDSKVCFIEWTVTNPKIQGITALKGVKLCVKEAKSFAEQMGYFRAIQFLRDERLLKYYRKYLDFNPTETATLMVSNLGGL